MPLYINVERIYNELRELGYSNDDALRPEELFPFDQFHYHGTDAVETAARSLALGPTSRVLEIGSGLGGPARYLAHKIGCPVTALELQSQLHQLACDLTTRTGLGDRVKHVPGDALTYPFSSAVFDAVVSWLAIHHIRERGRLLARCADTLKPTGKIYIEDLYQRAPFAEDDLPDVAQTIYGVTLTSAEDYVRDLHDAGFTNIEATDMTGDWTAFCGARTAAWRGTRERHERVHGASTYARLETFFSTVVRLFESGRLGGLRLIASRKPS